MNDRQTRSGSRSRLRSTAWAFCAFLASGRGVLAAGPPPTAADCGLERDPWARIAVLHDELDSYREGPQDRYDRPEYRALRDRFWMLLERQAVAALNQQPQASTGDLEAELAAEADDDWLSASLLRLPGGNAVVIALDAGFLGGTFFVAAPSSKAPAGFRIVWDIQPLARENYAARNELGRWAFPIPGFHDGPIGGRVLALPATSSGRPRFLVDAIASAEMGMTVPGQVSVWEWTGTMAMPEIIDAYETTYEIHDVQIDGRLIRVATKELTDVLYSCGACDEPRGTWKIRLEPDGVTDLGHAFAEPLLGVAVDLLTRIAKGESTSDLAAPEVIEQLTELVDSLRDQAGGEGATVRPESAADPLDGIRSMLGPWKVTDSGAGRELDLATDDWHIVLTFETVGGTDYAVSAEFPDSAS